MKYSIKCMIMFLIASFTLPAYAADTFWSGFTPPEDDKFDWIQLTSDEWLKGELLSLYDYELEFDSDELESLSFDFEDVRVIRTHRSFSVRIEDKKTMATPIVIEGLVWMNGDRVIITTGSGSREFTRNQMVSIAQSGEKRIDLWTGDVTLGTNIRKGNTDSIDFNLKANAKRLTASSRLELDYVSNYTEADKSETANNYRISVYRDLFITKKLFWRQITSEYYSDRFKNIDYQLTANTSLGYHLIYSPKTEWDISVGLGTRHTRYVSVEPGEDIENNSPSITAGTTYDTELTKAIDFLVDYNFQLVKKEAGTYTHHFVTSLETDLTSNIDLDISFAWDRIEDPQPDSSGVVPEKDDYQLIVGLNLEI